MSLLLSTYASRCVIVFIRSFTSPSHTFHRVYLPCLRHPLMRVRSVHCAFIMHGVNVCSACICPFGCIYQRVFVLRDEERCVHFSYSITTHLLTYSTSSLLPLLSSGRIAYPRYPSYLLSIIPPRGQSASHLVACQTCPTRRQHHIRRCMDGCLRHNFAPSA